MTGLPSPTPVTTAWSSGGDNDAHRDSDHCADGDVDPDAGRDADRPGHDRDPDAHRGSSGRLMKCTNYLGSGNTVANCRCNRDVTAVTL